jgi:hypothetical protein
VLEPAAQRPTWTAVGAAATALESFVTRRAGETLACAPLIGLALAGHDGGRAPVTVTGRWRGRVAGLTWAGHEEPKVANGDQNATTGKQKVEERHGYAGALPKAGGSGGHVGAPS